MTFAEKAASLLFFLLIIIMAVYPALPISQISIEVEIEPSTKINILELKLEELSLHHYGARKHNGKIPVIKEVTIKTSKGDLTPYYYVAKIPSGAYDQLIMKFSDAKAYINHDEIQLDINQKTIEKRITLEGGSHLEISLHIDEEELIANHTISINVEVNALNQ